jgi:hypothetical protein
MTTTEPMRQTILRAIRDRRRIPSGNYNTLAVVRSLLKAGLVRVGEGDELEVTEEGRSHAEQGR